MENDNSVAGFLGAVYDPAWFVAQQIPQEKPLVASENSIVLAHQLGNMYLGMCLVGLSLFLSTSEVKVIRSYLVALLIADAGHVGFTWYGMGSGRFFDVSGWNAMAWGNLGATVSLSSSFLFPLPLSSSSSSSSLLVSTTLRPEKSRAERQLELY